jgi:hypothetical protein
VGLLGQALVVLGRDRQLRRHLAERPRHQQRAGVGLEVGEEALDVAAGLGQPRGGVQGRPRVALRDGVDRAEQQIRVRRPQHGQHVVERDRRAGVGHELLQGAQGVAEGAGRRAGDERARLVGHLETSSSATRRSTAVIWPTVGRPKSNRWQRSTTVGRTLLASVVASTKIVFGGGSSSVFKKAFHAAVESMCASSRM